MPEIIFSFLKKTPLWLILLILLVQFGLFLQVFFFAKEPILFNGKEFGPVSVEKILNESAKSLNTSYVYRKNISHAVCLDIGEEIFKELKYKAKRYDKGILGWYEKNRSAIFCPEDKWANTIIYSASTVNKRSTFTILGDIREKLKEKIKEKANEIKYDLPYYAWAQFEIANLTDESCKKLSRDMLTAQNINDIKSSNKVTTGDKKAKTYMVYCSNNQVLINIFSKYGNVTEERDTLKEQYYKSMEKLKLKPEEYAYNNNLSSLIIKLNKKSLSKTIEFIKKHLEENNFEVFVDNASKAMSATGNDISLIVLFTEDYLFVSYDNNINSIASFEKVDLFINAISNYLNKIKS